MMPVLSSFSSLITSLSLSLFVTPCFSLSFSLCTPLYVPLSMCLTLSLSLSLSCLIISNRSAIISCLLATPSPPPPYAPPPATRTRYSRLADKTQFSVRYTKQLQKTNLQTKTKQRQSVTTIS